MNQKNQFFQPKRKRARGSNRKSGRRLNIRMIVLGFVSVTLLFSFSVAAYVYNLLNQNLQTKIPIVDDHVVGDGILDHLSDPEEVDNTVNSAVVSPAPAPVWGSGRVKVHVDPDFPIVRVDQKDPNVENFLVFGVDSRSAWEQKARTDSLIIITLDKNYNTIKMTSILRDTQVKIPGRTEPGKINSAYVFGGVGLLINTINQNFDLDIQKFAMVDMWSAEKIIDAMGGVSIDVRRDEVEYVNEGVRFTNILFSKNSEPSSYLTDPGLILLNGRQTIAYGRIRKIGSDIGRTARQRKVLSELLRQFKVAPLSNKLATMEEISRSFESSVAKDEMFFLAVDAFSLIKSVAQYRIPSDGMFQTNTSNWQIMLDFDQQIPALHDFIWGPVDTGAVSLPEETPESLDESADSSTDDRSLDSSISHGSSESDASISDYSESDVESFCSESTDRSSDSGSSQMISSGSDTLSGVSISSPSSQSPP
jgi:polyisoprenyl-teichoic acid--peptidoglycan teichoic acid transferase